MGPPSSLPGWGAINNAFLENLALCLSEHSQGEVGYDLAEFVLERRETADVAQPDLQAQLAEESIGEHYFALFEPLDIETWNDGHAAVAAVATTGKLRAIVTTNFDRLIELALAASGVKPKVFCAPEEFEVLSRHMQDPTSNPIDGLPVIKVHGSVGRPSTMVDTLRQRVLGRPKALEASLIQLFRTHALMVVGFSGADLAYDPQYLGLREGTRHSPSFTVINRCGEEPRQALFDLIVAAPQPARMMDGTVPDCLIALTGALGHCGPLQTCGWDPELEFPGIRKATLPASVHQSWGKSISPVQASVILARIADAAGSSDAAFRLLTRTMPHHIKHGLISDPAMPEQLGMIAAILIESCHIATDSSAGRFEGELSALQVLSAKGVRLNTESLALEALALALSGDAMRSDAAGLRALRESREQFKPTVRADTICALARSWTVAEKWGGPYVEALRQTYDLMQDWGDEPRKARVGVMLCRFLIEAGDLSSARLALAESWDVARRLNLGLLGNDLVAVSGRLHLAEKRYDKAMSYLLSASKNYEAGQKNLRQAETLLPLSEAAVGAGDADCLQRSLATFETVLPLVPGMALPYAATRVRFLSAAGAFDEASAAVADLRSLGDRWGGHPWIRALADRLDSEIVRTIAKGS
jgi:hypothetical protein